LSIVAVVVLAMLQDYRDRLIIERLKDISAPVYVQFRTLVQREASWDEVWSNLTELSQERGAHVLLVDSEGNVIRQASPRGSQKQQFVELLPGEASDSGAAYYDGTYKAANGQTFIFIAYPVASTQRSVNPQSLVLSLSRGGALALWPSLIRPFLWAGLIALGVSISIAFLLARSVYRPIQRVTAAADKLAQGQYDEEVPVTGPREVRGLAAGFNQMARQVKLTEQRLRYFVADVSHQLRTPLTSIRGFAQAILDGTASDEDSRLRSARVIEDESMRMIRQVNELLELARMQSGQIEMVRDPVDVKDLLEHCQEIFSIRAEEQNVRLTAKIEPLMPVIGDIDRLEQVYSNLLDNALKHSPSGGEVSIVGRNVATDYVEVKIIDSGPGIPPEQISMVFERFYQAGGERTGTGLGLAIAREIVLAHNGKIDVSSAPGEGTEFTVRLSTIASHSST